MRLLIIEDEKRIAENLRTLLQKEKFAVDWAATGDQGLAKLLVEPYDLAIVDWQLPGLSGPEVCQQARQEGVQAALLMLTSRGQIEDKVEGLNRGADDYLVKPFAFAELLARVRALLRRPEAVLSSNVLTYGDLQLDLGKGLVLRAGQRIELSPREFALLEYLLRHAEQACSREQLLEHVWDEHADPFSNTVEVHIRYLRQKIDEPFEDKLIRTIRGKGYCLCQD